jgi:hypothetical protein
VLSQLQTSWSRKLENKLKKLVDQHFPLFSADLLRVNYAAPSLHMRFLNEAIDTSSLEWLRRATQSGDRCATYPLLFEWNLFSSQLKKFVVFCLVRFFAGGPRATLQLLPCSIMKLIDFLEWLPSAGMNVGWTSIRHYCSWVQMFSMICGYGTIKTEDIMGWKMWKDNFKANIQVIRSDRGGDLPLMPFYLRLLLRVWNSDSDEHVMMRSMGALMWFSALRPCHFSPETLKPKDMKHLLEWQFLRPYQVTASRVLRTILNLHIPSMKQHQKEAAKDWSTATACICAGFTDCTQEEFVQLTALCPVCALERWRQRVARLRLPTLEFTNFVFFDPRTGKPILRSRCNEMIREALDVALAHIPQEDRERIVKMLSMKSWRSGVGTEIVTKGNAGFVAAAFLAHSQTDITQTYYHKGGDLERISVLPDLVDSIL